MSGNLVNVILTNRKAEFQQPYPHERLRPWFSFRPDGYHFMPKYRMGVWDGWISFLRRHAVPSGLFRDRRQEIEQKSGIHFQVVWKCVKPALCSPAVFPTDREYQKECVKKMLLVAGHGGGLILNATGSGKTRIAGIFFKNLLGAGCFIVDELTLLKQARTEIEDVLGERVGEIGNQRFSPQRVTVATVQTVHRHRADPKFQAWVKSLDVLFIDEIHLAMNRRSFQTVAAIRPKAVFGLTATLEVEKKNVRIRATALSGPVLFEYPISRGVMEGFLVPGVVYQLPFPNSCIHVQANRFSELYERLVVMNARRNWFIADLVQAAYVDGKQIVVLVERIKHLQELSDMLSDIPHRVVCGLKTVEERLAAKKKFQGRRIRLLLANKVFKKGVDIPNIDVIIDGAAMKSKTDCIQKYGRGVRLCEGKAGLLYFDIGDVEMHSDCKNPFEKAARSRLRAFRKAEIPIRKLKGVEEGVGASQFYAQAVAGFRAVLAKEKKTSSSS